MKKKKIGILILAMTLILAVVFTGCDTGLGSGGTADRTDPALNGLWGVWWENQFISMISFNNGYFELHDGLDGPYARGTFTTSGNNLTLRVTHIHGRPCCCVCFAHYGFGPRWYTLLEARLLAQAANAWDFLEDLNGFIDPYTITYSVSGNTLTTIHPQGNAQTFHRR